MRILALFTSVIFLTLVSCGGVKERKTDNGGSTVENVTNYPDYDSDTAFDTTLNLADSDNFKSDTLETADDILEKTEIGGDGYESYSNNSTTGNTGGNTTVTGTGGNNTTGNNTTTTGTNNNSTTTTTTTTTGNTGTSTTGTTTGDKKTTTKKSTTGKTYYLIGGSFKKEKKANLLIRQLKKEGYSAEILPGENGYHRVSVAKYWKKDDAMKNLQTLRRKYTKMSFWILVH